MTDQLFSFLFRQSAHYDFRHKRLALGSRLNYFSCFLLKNGLKWFLVSFFFFLKISKNHNVGCVSSGNVLVCARRGELHIIVDFTFLAHLQDAGHKPVKIDLFSIIAELPHSFTVPPTDRSTDFYGKMTKHTDSIFCDEK